MSDEPNYGGESLSLSALAQVHGICSEFETAFRAGSAPEIEEYIKRIGQDSSARCALLLSLCWKPSSSCGADGASGLRRASMLRVFQSMRQ